MEGVLWQLLASSRGAHNRVRIIQLLDERPRNANELAENLELDYTTVRHHLDVLIENKVITEATEGYGAIFMFTEQSRDHWDVIEQILDTVGETS